MPQGLTEDQYPALRDRPVQNTLVSTGAGNKKRRKGKKMVGKLSAVGAALRAIKGTAALGDEGEEEGREDAGEGVVSVRASRASSPWSSSGD